MRWQEIGEMPHTRFVDGDTSRNCCLRIKIEGLHLSYGSGYYVRLELLTLKGWINLHEVVSKQPGEEEIKTVKDCQKELKEYAEFLYPNNSDRSGSCND